MAGHPRDTAGSLGLFSPHNYAADIEASGAAIYSYSGWLDGAYPHAAIKRYLTIRTPGSRLILGPWNHGGGWDISPPRPKKSGFDHTAELLRFFDYHLKGIDTGIEDEKPVRYFTMVEGKWKDADGWPPPATTVTYYCAANNLLSRSAPAARDERDEYRVDYTAGTGDHSRWRTQAAIDAAVRYPDRQRQDEKLLVYTSPPLDRSIEVTGHALVTLFVSSTQHGRPLLRVSRRRRRVRTRLLRHGRAAAGHTPQTQRRGTPAPAGNTVSNLQARGRAAARA